MASYNVMVRVSDDNLEAYIILKEDAEGKAPPLSAETLEAALRKAGVAWGIDGPSLNALAGSPVPGIEFLAASGSAPVDGTDGSIEFYVKRSDEYKPEYGGDSAEKVDYKNVDVFQLVTKGKPLCAVTKPAAGTDGMNVYGGVIPAKEGKAAPPPNGANTEWNVDGTQLLASVDGVVNFKGAQISVVEVLRIQGDVDMSTGNIRFGGDVIVNGSINEGFSVECGGSLTVRGKIGNAHVNVAGNLLVSEGINGGHQKSIEVGGFMRCRYIESGNIRIDGDVFADYIIDTNIVCKGNINLNGSKSLLIGGRTAVLGELSANYIGNARGVRTRVELIELPTEEERMAGLKGRQEAARASINSDNENLTKVRKLIDVSDRPELQDLYRQLTERIIAAKEELRAAESGIAALKNSVSERFPGSVLCRRIMYSGVDLFAGGQMMMRDQSNLEHCRIRFEDGEWANGLA
ncbi:MAG: FapA family protein [Clostridiales Family XIII bacterium]|jgi:uncharacterized protein (DUF342 family)|nr:FapA family protein [Clostridiales Family XIII bacterium]